MWKWRSLRMFLRVCCCQSVMKLHELVRTHTSATIFFFYLARSSSQIWVPCTRISARNGDEPGNTQVPPLAHTKPSVFCRTLQMIPKEPFPITSSGSWLSRKGEVMAVKEQVAWNRNGSAENNRVQLPRDCDVTPIVQARYHILYLHSLMYNDFSSSVLLACAIDTCSTIERGNSANLCSHLRSSILSLPPDAPFWTIRSSRDPSQPSSSIWEVI